MSRRNKWFSVSAVLIVCIPVAISLVVSNSSDASHRPGAFSRLSANLAIACGLRTDWACHVQNQELLYEISRILGQPDITPLAKDPGSEYIWGDRTMFVPTSLEIDLRNQRPQLTNDAREQNVMVGG